MYFKLFAFFVTVLAIQAQYYPPPPDTGVRVAIRTSHGMTPSMELDASDFLKAAFAQVPGKRHPTTPDEACVYLRDSFINKHSDHLWHVVAYKAYAIQSLKSIELAVGNDLYYLFATKK